MQKQPHALERGHEDDELVMNSGELERERGIITLAKNTAVAWNGVKINVVNAPG